MNNKVILIDASPIFYKAFFAIPPLSSKNGVPTNAAYGYSNTLIKILKKYNPENIVVCFDNKNNFRKDILQSYKSERKPMASSLQVQVPIVKQITEALGIRVLELDGYEADDLIGMMAKISKNEGREVLIISPDKDLCQLVDDTTSVLDFSKNKLYTRVEVKEKFGIEPSQITDLLGLSGDPSDGIPGILGIGAQTAIKLINEYGSLENILKNTDNLKAGIKKKIEAGHQLGLISKKLATIETDTRKCPIQTVDESVKGFADKKQLTDLFDALNFLSLKDKIADLE